MAPHLRFALGATSKSNPTFSPEDALERTAKLQQCSLIALVGDNDWIGLVGDPNVLAAASAAQHAIETSSRGDRATSPRSTLSRFMPTEYRKVAFTFTLTFTLTYT